MYSGVSRGNKISRLAHGTWMKKPVIFPNLPYGLEYLTVLDEVFLEPQMPSTSSDCNNAYIIKNNIGEIVYYVKEYANDSAPDQSVWGYIRWFRMEITDRFGQVVLNVTHPLPNSKFLALWSLQTIRVETGTGALLGTVHECWTAWVPKYVVLGVEEDVLFWIKGSCFMCASLHLCNNTFKVLDCNRSTVLGYLIKFVSGFSRDPEVIGISFPRELNVYLKALHLGVAILLDYVHYVN